MYGQVIGYAYEADIHCPACAMKRFGVWANENTVKDSEGNHITPVLDGQDTNDLTSDMICGDCHTVLYEAPPQPREMLYIDYQTQVSRESLQYQGKFLAYADGGYPLLYITDEGQYLCAPCADKNDANYSHDLLKGADIFYEGQPQECAECGDLIESAYGDPDAEPEGPEEGDITTSDYRHFYQYGKLAFTVEDDGDMDAKLRAYMERDGFYPNVWSISDHGNPVLLNLSQE
jgi:hypothetical protein